jgi:hypothetical protein
MTDALLLPQSWWWSPVIILLHRVGSSLNTKTRRSLRPLNCLRRGRVLRPSSSLKLRSSPALLLHSLGMAGGQTRRRMGRCSTTLSAPVPHARRRLKERAMAGCGHGIQATPTCERAISLVTKMGVEAVHGTFTGARKSPTASMHAGHLPPVCDLRSHLIYAFLWFIPLVRSRSCAPPR